MKEGGIVKDEVREAMWSQTMWGPDAIEGSALS